MIVETIDEAPSETFHCAVLRELCAMVFRWRFASYWLHPVELSAMARRSNLQLDGQIITYKQIEEAFSKSFGEEKVVHVDYFEIRREQRKDGMFYSFTLNLAAFERTKEAAIDRNE